MRRYSVKRTFGTDPSAAKRPHLRSARAPWRAESGRVLPSLQIGGCGLQIGKVWASDRQGLGASRSSRSIGAWCGASSIAWRSQPPVRDESRPLASWRGDLGDAHKLVRQVGYGLAHPVMAGEGRPSTTSIAARKQVVDGQPEPVLGLGPWAGHDGAGSHHSYQMTR